MPTNTTTESSIVLDNISWATYERLLKEAGERHVRFTYDNGELEIMTLSHEHESFKSFIHSLIVFLAFELGLALRMGGSNTLKKKLKKKGLEPDDCFWIEHEQAMRGKEEFDPKLDPPPDLALEVDVASSSMNRMSIYAALQIPEIWRWKRRRLRVYRLRPDGRGYQEVEQSLAFPYLPVSELHRFILMSETEEQIKVLHLFVDWVREQVLPAYKEFAKKSTKPAHGNGKK